MIPKIAPMQMSSGETDSFSAASLPLRHDVLGALSEPARAIALQDAKELNLRKGQVLFHKGDRADCAYFIRRGIIKISIISPAGEQRIVALQGPRAMVGDLSLIDGAPRGVTAEAMISSDVLAISRTSFQASIRHHPDLHAQISLMLTQRLRTITDEIMQGAFLPMRARMARAMLRVAQLLGEHIGVDLYGIEQAISQGDIAGMAGVTRESVNRTLTEWRNEGVLATSSRHKLVLNVRRLMEEASQAGDASAPSSRAL
jgi:CRP/FNR family transcriptional regulator